MKRALLVIVMLALFTSGCALPVSVTAVATETPVMTPKAPAQTPEKAPEETPAQAAEASPATIETPAPPQPVTVTVGAIGDILMMTSQISGAKQEDGSYDFSASLAPMQALFTQTDFMCANLETPLAGEEAGYTQPRPEAPAPTAEEPSPERPFQTFNAPDALAANLAAAGIDLVTTANNHCLDRNAAGLYRTIEVIKSAGLLQTGSFSSEAARNTPCIAEVKGIKLGFVAMTSNTNRRDRYLSDEERSWAVARLERDESTAADIARVREAGADFVIVFPHWGTEYESQESSSQRRLAEWLITRGADAVIGSHPHVVQPIEELTAERNGREVTAPVVYSLGNFISNMAPSPRDYGLFVRLSITKEADGSVHCSGIEYLPLLTVRQRPNEGRVLHQTLPCHDDMSLVHPAVLEDSLPHELASCAEHVDKICGGYAARIR